MADSIRGDSLRRHARHRAGVCALDRRAPTRLRGRGGREPEQPRSTGSPASERGTAAAKGGARLPSVALSAARSPLSPTSLSQPTWAAQRAAGEAAAASPAPFPAREGWSLAPDAAAREGCSAALLPSARSLEPGTLLNRSCPLRGRRGSALLLSLSPPRAEPLGAWRRDAGAYMRTHHQRAS